MVASGNKDYGGEGAGTLYYKLHKTVWLFKVGNDFDKNVNYVLKGNKYSLEKAQKVQIWKENKIKAIHWVFPENHSGNIGFEFWLFLLCIHICIFLSRRLCC